MLKTLEEFICSICTGLRTKLHKIKDFLQRLSQQLRVWAVDVFSAGPGHYAESDGCGCMLQHSQEACFADAGVSAAHCDSAGSTPCKIFLPLVECAGAGFPYKQASNFTNQRAFSQNNLANVGLD